MVATFFFTCTLVLSVLCVVLGVIAWESSRSDTAKALRRWRIAWSKRKEIDAALASARNAHAQAAAADQQAKAAVADATRAANDAIQDARKTQDDARKQLATMGSYIIADQCTTHIKTIKASNYHAKEKKVLRAINVAGRNGYTLPDDEQAQIVRMLKQAHERAIRVDEEKQRQAAIKEEMREEARAEREYARLVKKADEERQRKQREAQIRQQALEEAIALLGDTHSEQLDDMKQKLAEAQAEAETARLAAERAKSMAQQTKRGHIYIISNLGSFGDNVFKVGMTRRLDPLDRVKELGDASVPFPFDVHAMITSDDAPALEAALHRKLDAHRVNRVNRRKEFFRVPLSDIIAVVRDEHGEVTYEADAEALEYHESLESAHEHNTLETRMRALTPTNEPTNSPDSPPDSP